MGTGITLSQFIPPSEAVAIYKGDSFKVVLTVRDGSNVPVDFTAATCLAQIRNTAGSLVDTFTATLGGTAGTITLALSAAQTAALSTSGLYKSDVQVTLAGDVTTYLVLRIRVVADVSYT